MARPDDLADATVLVGNPVVNCRGGGIFGLPSQYPVVSGEQRSSNVRTDPSTANQNVTHARSPGEPLLPSLPLRRLRVHRQRKPFK